MASDPTSPGPRNSKLVAQWLLLGVVLLTLSIAMAAAQWRDYKAVGDAERAQLRTQARVVDELFTTQVQYADAALRTLLENIESWRGPDGYSPQANAHLNQVAALMPSTRTFTVLDANGICQLSSRSGLLGQDFSYRAYFQQAAADKTGKVLHITPPFQSVLNAWSVTLSIAIVRPNGEFGGVVTATLSPDYFDLPMRNLRYAPDLRVTLVHDQGVAYFSSPFNPLLYKENRLDSNTFFKAHLDSGLPETDFSALGLSGVPVIAVTRTVDLHDLRASHNFVAIATRNAGAVYADWRFMNAVLLALWLAMTALSCWALWRHQRSAARLGARIESAQQAIASSNQRFEQMAQTIPCMLFELEVLGPGDIRPLYVGPYSQTLFGVAPEALMADYKLLVNMILPEDRGGVDAVLHKAIAKRQGFDCEFRITTTAGEQRWLKATATPTVSDTAPRVTHFSGFVFDITEAKRLQLKLQELAYQDPLTQADNRRSFMEKLQNEINRAQRYGEQASLLMLDIDFFKQVNDTYGHVVGDAVLKHLVAVLREGLRGVDSLGRLGGEEFAVLLPGTSLEAAVQLAERLRRAVQTRPTLQTGETVPFTISLGVVAITADVPDLQTVLHCADKAMYHAKQTGRNRVCTAAQAPPTTLHSALD